MFPRNIGSRFSLAARGFQRQRAPLRSVLRYYSAEAESEKKLQELLQKIQSRPEIIEHLKGLQDLILEKGLFPNPDPSTGAPKPLGVMQQVKILMDADVRNHLAELGKKMDEAGIRVSREDVSVLMSLMKSK